MNGTAFFDLINEYAGNKTVEITIARHVAYRIRNGWLELLKNSTACAGRETFHRNSNWLIIAQTEVIRTNSTKNVIRRSDSHRFGVNNPSTATTRKITTLSVKANINP